MTQATVTFNVQFTTKVNVEIPNEWKEYIREHEIDRDAAIIDFLLLNPQLEDIKIPESLKVKYLEDSFEILKLSFNE